MHKKANNSLAKNSFKGLDLYRTPQQLKKVLKKWI